MKSFVDAKYQADRHSNLSVGNRYLEIEIPSNGSLSMFVYLIPRSESSLLIATCWEHIFDSLLEDFNEDNWEMICKTSPTLAQLINNSIQNKYREGVLIRLEDSDDGESKWFLAAVSANHDCNDVDDLLDARTHEIIKFVAERSTQLATELEEKKPNVLQAMGKRLIKGVRNAVTLFGSKS